MSTPGHDTSTVPDDHVGHDEEGACPPATSGAVLALFEGDVRVALLAPSRPVVLGRSPRTAGCVALAVGDAKLSRDHIRFSLTPTGRVLVEDLGSRNGAWFGQERIAGSRELWAGESVRAGSVTACIHLFNDARSIRRTAVLRADEALLAGASIRAVWQEADRVARSRLPVLLLGETGTGKELVARRIHELGSERDAPMVRVNCGAIPVQLVESTLFGHERGAFTGAFAKQKGLFEEADGGTLFLDEVGELSPGAQAALLRVLETGVFRRVGASRDSQVSVRVVAATHRDLKTTTESGHFRADLYYRLSTFTLRIPPLRERRDEIEGLAARFREHASEANGRRVTALEPGALARLEQYDWPGNVRELKNAIERAVVIAPGSVIREEDLPGAVRAEKEPCTSEPPESLRWDELQRAKRKGEASAIRAALEQTGWKRAEAAQRLGMPLRTLAYKVKALGIERA